MYQGYRNTLDAGHSGSGKASANQWSEGNHPKHKTPNK